MGINEENLKSFNEDKYNRKNLAENLTKIIDSEKESIVMSLDSKWGTGKTTFVLMWKDMLDNGEEYKNKFKTIYFNAWENDYTKDPLLALFLEIQSQLKEDDNIIQNALTVAKDKLKTIIKTGASIGVKALTNGILNIDGINLGDFNEEQIRELASNFTEVGIKAIEENKNTIKEFKEAMNDYQNKCDKKIIFFIDELDRCRPTFAIELLEVVKHIFNIENCIFIISIDKQQLSYSAESIYGSKMDTMGYLRRFFDLDYNLPSIPIKQYIDNKYSRIFDGKFNIELFKEFSKEIFERANFSLRDIDKAFYYIKLLIPLIDEFNKEEVNYKDVYILIISYLYSILIGIRIKKPMIYKKIVEGNYIVEEISKEIIKPNLNKYNGIYIMNFHCDVARKIINDLFDKFLSLNLAIINGINLDSINDNNYSIGLNNENNDFFNENCFNLKKLFKNKESDLLNKLEFISSFANE